MSFLTRDQNITCVNGYVSKKRKLYFVRSMVARFNQLTSSTKTLGDVRIILKIGKIARTLNAPVVQGMETELLLGLATVPYLQLNLDFSTLPMTQQGLQLGHSIINITTTRHTGTMSRN